MIKVLFEDNHCLVIEKPCNIPMQKDSSNDDDLLSMAKRYLKEKYHKPGEVYLGLVHRLDRPVGGVCIFAKTSKAAMRLSKQINDHTFKKTYLAIAMHDGLAAKGHFEDHLLKDPKTNMVKVDPKGKLAILDYELLAKKTDKNLVKINLKTGRSHQIRVQFSSRGHALFGDQRYNKEVIPHTQIALWSYSLSFNHPTLKNEMTFRSLPFDHPSFKDFKEVLQCLNKEELSADNSSSF